jgi:hypothetical protein
MSLSAFPKMKKTRPIPAAISDVTLRDFSGGLKVTENQLALKSKFATKLVNMFADADTSQVLRFGTKEFATCPANIINTRYYRQSIVSVLVDGTVARTTSAGVTTIIWNETIANALAGTPDGWAAGVVRADFTEFRGKLLICNGVDKPLIIASDFAVDYLQDPSAGTNVNTPIGFYMTTVSNYVVMAGISGEEDTIYISSSGTSGVWPGDATPNDSLSFNVAAYSSNASSAITAIGSFKNFLMVYFKTFSIAISLGTYNAAGTHVPEVIDVYEGLGTVSSKTIETSNKDLIFPSSDGVFSAEKAVFNNTLTTSSLSADLGDDYIETIGLVPADDSSSFIVNDPLSKTIFFVFQQSTGGVKSFALRYTDNMVKKSWCEIQGWSFTAACVSENGRLFFAQGTKLYQYGNSVYSNENYYADYITGASIGNDIVFDWEFPWLDAGNRIKTKKLKNITFDTTGTSNFSLQCFVNNYYLDGEGAYDPAVSMDFVAGNAGGYGLNAGGYGGNGYGGGRRANDERFFALPIKFKILKLRVFGATKLPLRIASLSLIYARGNYN